MHVSVESLLILHKPPSSPLNNKYCLLRRRWKDNKNQIQDIFRWTFSYFRRRKLRLKDRARKNKKIYNKTPFSPLGYQLLWRGWKSQAVGSQGCLAVSLDCSVSAVAAMNRKMLGSTSNERFQVKSLHLLLP